MGKYMCGGPDVVLRLTGRSAPVTSGEVFEHDFSAEGPEGEHGPSREASLITAGAMTRVEPPPPPPARRVDDQVPQAAPDAAETTDESPARSSRRKKE